MRSQISELQHNIEKLLQRDIELTNILGTEDDMDDPVPEKFVNKIKVQ